MDLMYVSGKVEVILVHPMKTCMGRKGTIPPMLNLSIL
jgi:hypothetical protein